MQRPGTTRFGFHHDITKPSTQKNSAKVFATFETMIGLEESLLQQHPVARNPLHFISLQYTSLHFTQQHTTSLCTNQQPVLGPPTAVIKALFEKPNLVSRQGLGIGVTALVVRQVTHKGIRFDAHKDVARL